MELLKKIKINFKCDGSWMKSKNISFSNKISFLLRKYWAVVLNKRKIVYLDATFTYDSRFSPIILEIYPEEIHELDKAIKVSELGTVLDVGANIGQWSFTLKKLFPKIKVFSFEPNKEVFNILNKNNKEMGDTTWSIFPYAISSKDESRAFYFSKSATAEGSFYKENMTQNYVRTDVQQGKVEAISLTKENIKKLKIPQKFDLVKIDVEGAEMDVLKGLINIDFKYLQIEVIRTRKIGVTSNQVIDFFKSRGIEAKLIHEDFFDSTSPAGNAIFEIIKKR